jgi:anaerobic magnesium-protoporphyrin IX monomethyl ester cyclase
MGAPPVVLVAFEEFDNLGVRYLAAVLSEKGFDPEIINFRDGNERILQKIKRFKPVVVGFSVIFQYHIYEFKELINYLRESGIRAHFCAGGQYASLRYRDLLEAIPFFDSIVRFEGEYTFLELVGCLYSGADWRKLKGIAYKENGQIIVNQLRLAEKDLDKFPFPMRPPLEDYALGKKFATLIAGRGCINNCSFCNNTEYLKQSSVHLKRLRKPEKVVSEIYFLFNEKDCSVFLFDDDDFPVKTENGSDWIERFCEELTRKRLSDKIIWKINCRPDQVDYKSFALMKAHGLFLVFLGIDDGTDSGLSGINKNMTVAKSLNGINNLKKLDISFDYGFMLFQPSSTFETINKNLDFLGQTLSDGYAPVKFLKMMPYFDTRIEKELRKEGRLKGLPGFLDYDFLDGSLNDYYEFIRNSFVEWMGHSEGLANTSIWAGNYFSVISHFYKITSKVKQLSDKTRKIVAQSNLFFIDRMKELAIIFKSGRYDPSDYKNLAGYKEDIKKHHDKYKEQIIDTVTKACSIAEYQTMRQLIRIQS